MIKAVSSSPVRRLSHEPCLHYAAQGLHSHLLFSHSSAGYSGSVSVPGFKWGCFFYNGGKGLPLMGSQETVKQLEECSVSNALGTWVFSAAGALLAIPLGIKRKSFGPLVFFGTTGTMLDIIMGITACEREHAERQMKLLEAQNAANEESAMISGSDS